MNVLLANPCLLFHWSECSFGQLERKYKHTRSVHASLDVTVVDKNKCRTNYRNLLNAPPFARLTNFNVINNFDGSGAVE